MSVNYDEILLEYDLRYKATLPDRGKALIELASRYHAKQILKVGCGMGYWLAALFGCSSCPRFGFVSRHARANAITCCVPASRSWDCDPVAIRLWSEWRTGEAIF